MKEPDSIGWMCGRSWSRGMRAYWHKLSEGKSVGFRKLARGSQGTWLARYRDG